MQTIGKNINLRFNETLSEFEKNYGAFNSINDYYCISNEHGNLSLFYIPNDPNYRRSQIQIFASSSSCDDLYYTFNIITENDIIDHDNKKNPIIPQYYYFISSYYPKNQYVTLNYQFEYIKYESDNGLIFKNTKIDNGIIFSDISYEFNTNNNSLGVIKFGQIEKNYSYYRRNYEKIQSLLAQIMSVINLMIEIGKLLSYFLLDKKMSKDIIKNLIDKSINNITISHTQIGRNIKDKKFFKNLEKNELFEKKIELTNDKSNSKINFNKNISTKIENSIKLSEKEGKMKIIINKINFCDVFKSLFCCKNNKIKLINICDNLIKEDICIEKILYRFYKLDNFLSKKERYALNLDKNEKFKEINYYINKIYNESKMIFN